MDFSKIETKDLIVEVYYLLMQAARIQERLIMLNQEISKRPPVVDSAQPVMPEPIPAEDLSSK